MTLKKCSKCKLHKDVSEFDKDTSKPDGYYSSCKNCRRLQSKTYYENNKHRAKERRESNWDYIYDYLSDSCCINCGETDIILLDFDHRDPTEKVANVSQMASWSIESIDKEIAKCDVLCSHCHRYKTAHEQNWYVLKYKEKRKKLIDN